MNLFVNFFLFTFLPIFSFFIAERCFLLYLVKSEKRKEWVKKQFWLHPNFISRCRYPMGVISVLLYHYISPHAGVLSFSMAILSDITDGTIARNFHLHSKEGEIIDPLSDKLLYFPPLFYLCYLEVLSWIWVILFLILDMLGQFSRYFIENKAANLFGKAKSFLTTITLIVSYLQLVYLPDANWKSPQILLIGSTFLGFCSTFFKLIPNYWYANLLSILNFLCGICGILLIFLGFDLIYAFSLVFLGQFMDLFDGQAAERWGSTPRGELLDDLADGTNFGGTIAVIIYFSFENSLLGGIVSTIYCICTIYRLIRFLVNKKKEGIEGGVSIFIGLPSPAGALVAGSSALLFQEKNIPIDFFDSDWLKTIIILFVSYLMTSKLQYIHFGRVFLTKLPKIVKVLLLTLIFTIIITTLSFRNQISLLSLFFILSSLYLVLGHVCAKTKKVYA